MSRLAGLDGAAFDAIVVGGGIAGAGVARDLALRGASVALFEKGDFASGTTSKSSKLIHGGLRYLELFDWRLVRESLREKRTLERLAPQLVRPLPFLVPVYPGSKRGLITVRIGMWLYDLLTPGKVADRYRMLRPVEALSLEPNIRPEDLRGAGYYTDDLLLFPERLCLENILSAIRHGARAFNYCEIEEFVRSDDVVHGVRPAQGAGDDGQRAGRPQLRGPVGGSVAPAGRARRGTAAGEPDHQGHPLPASPDDRARHLRVRPRRPHGLRDPVARLLAGRH